MIDFHSHILPGIDDGSKSVEQSLEMLRALGAQGIKVVVATPHFYANDESVSLFLERRSAAYEKLREAMDDTMPTVLLGAEVRFYPGIENLADIDKLCIEGTDVLLLEMPFLKWSDFIVREVIKVSTFRNLTLVLAHIDRYLSFQDKGTWKRLLESDVLMQANAGSFGRMFTGAKMMKMLRLGAVQLIGTDCHNMDDRAPNMDTASEKIIKKLGEDFMVKFTEQGHKLLNI